MGEAKLLAFCLTAGILVGVLGFLVITSVNVLIALGEWLRL